MTCPWKVVCTRSAVASGADRVQPHECVIDRMRGAAAFISRDGSTVHTNTYAMGNSPQSAWNLLQAPGQDGIPSGGNELAAKFIAAGRRDIIGEGIRVLPFFEVLQKLQAVSLRPVFPGSRKGCSLSY